MWDTVLYITPIRIVLWRVFNFLISVFLSLSKYASEPYSIMVGKRALQVVGKVRVLAGCELVLAGCRLKQ